MIVDIASGANLAAAAAVAVCAGALNSVAGGGSLILFPTLVGLGLPTVAANVTNSVAQWPGYAGGVVGFRGSFTGQRRRLIHLSMVALWGGTVGAGLLLTTPSSAFDVLVPALVLLASLLLAAQPWLGRRLASARTGGDDRDPRWLYVTVFAGTVYGGYFGGALGVILLGLLGLGLGNLKVANAVKTVLSLVTATVTALVFGLFGPVSWVFIAVCAPAGLLGGFLGAKVATRLPVTPLRWFIASFGVLAAVYLALFA
ncbi:sulfite exporter TauE/SafE family protein [Klenkia terrae]|uniref:Probable membrane transporter protein n=1 Tax=Klenkia terrae TaxID=1052259 RepID=A0ABU8E5D3_9ACTN|nr:sulfite exporter TauE/SafE family protein [Klenkia terrae]SSC25952.1 Transmembrane protein TauE-like [Klenkia terrae]